MILEAFYVMDKATAKGGEDVSKTYQDLNYIVSEKLSVS